jgi:predicted flap endonuclease-1-like 5' DNA nuclease
MMYLLAQLWFYLLLAGLIGAWIGWLCTRCKIDHAGLDNRIAQLEADLRKASGEIEAHRGAALKLTTDLDGARSNLKLANTDWQGKYAKLEVGLTDWRGRYGKLEIDLKAARAEADSHRTSALKLTSDLDGLRSSNTSLVSDWQGKYSRLEGDLRTARGELDAGRASIAKLTSELDACRKSQPQSNKSFVPSVATRLSSAELEAQVLAAGDGVRPLAYGTVPDDLKEIGGIGPVNEQWLHKQGVFYFWQIASWTPAEAAWIAKNLPKFGGRVYKENWMEQAVRLARGELTDAKAKYQRGEHT